MFNIGSVTGYLKLNTAGWRGPMVGINTSINKLSSSFIKLGVVGAGSLLLIEREFGKFDKAIRHATSVSETSAEQFVQMSEMALDASVKWNKAATQTAQAFYYLGSAGLTVTEQMQAFNDTIMLSRAMGSELSSTVEGLVDITRAFGLEFANTRIIVDQLAKTVISSNQNFRDLDQALTYGASTARLTNNTLAETTAMLGVMANAGIKGCYDDQTEVLVKRGWIKWDEVVASDEFATCNPDTGGLEYQKSTKLIRYHHKGKMYHVANRGIDLCVTPDHRMWVKRRGHDEFEVKYAHEVDGKEVKYQAGGLTWDGWDMQNVQLLGFKQNRSSWVKNIAPMEINADVWATFLGWYISEGSCDFRKGNYRIRITQNRGKVRDRMREVLAKLPVTVNECKDGFTLANEQIWRAVKPLGKTPEKHIPKYALDWSPRLLSLLLTALMEGDGDCNECYYTSSKQLADQAMEVALKLGVSATAVIKSKAGSLSNYDKEGREIRARYDQWKVSIKREQLEPAYYPTEYKGVHGDRLDGSKFPACNEWIDYDGEVFCAEVPNHLLIVRRNGKPVVSGNSMAGTVLRRAMTNLMSPTGDMAGLIYKLGLHIYDASGKMKPFINIMGEISDKLKGTSEEYKNMVFEVLFGRRAIAGQIVLFNEGSVGLRKYATEIKNAGGTAERVAGKQMKAFTEQMGQLWKEVSRLAITMGGTLAPAIMRVGESLKARISQYRAYVTANSNAVATTLKWTAAIATLLLVGGPLLLVITSLATKLVVLAGVITNPFIALIAALYVFRSIWKQTNKEIRDELAKSVRETALEAVGTAGIVLSSAFAGGATGSALAGVPGGLILGAVGFGYGWYQAGKALDEYDAKLGMFASKNKKTYGVSGSFGKPAAEGAFAFRKLWETTTESVAKQIKVDFAGALDLVDIKVENTDSLLGRLLLGMKGYGANLNKMFKAFMTEPDARFSLITKRIEELNGEMGKYINNMKDVSGATENSSKKMGKLALEWSNALRTVFAPPAGTGVTWKDTFVSTLKSIESAWSDSIYNIMDTGGTFKSFFKDLFDGILNSFKRFIADVAAADLLYAMFGEGKPRLPGTPSILDLLSPSPAPSGSYTGGLGMPAMDMSRGKIAVSINVDNKGAPVSMRETGRTFNGRELIISTVMDEYNTNPNFRNAIKE